jgi:hypothetical protein
MDSPRNRLTPTPQGGPEYEIRKFTQTLDHFNSENIGDFDQRLLVTDKYYRKGTGAPIFVFTGAEGGDVTKYYSYAYGHAVAYAQRKGGLIVFLEHRFFGKSLPFATGSDDPKPDKIGLLSVSLTASLTLSCSDGHLSRSLSLSGTTLCLLITGGSL